MDHKTPIIELQDDDPKDDIIYAYKVPVVTLEDNNIAENSIVTLEDDNENDHSIELLKDQNKKPIVTLDDTDDQVELIEVTENNDSVKTIKEDSLPAIYEIKTEIEPMEISQITETEIVLDDSATDDPSDNCKHETVIKHTPLLNENVNISDSVITVYDVDDEVTSSSKTNVESACSSTTTLQNGSPCKSCHKKGSNILKATDPISKLDKRITTKNSAAKQFICDVCKEIFKDKEALLKHSKTHAAEKPYVCDICFKGFGDKNILRMHYNTHTGEKPFACTICDKVFSNTVSLKNHYQTHIGEKPYVCDVCLTSFDEKSTLSGHKLDEHHFLTVI